jgi:hypothetical protein
MSKVSAPFNYNKNMIPGEDRAWERLADLDPSEVCENTLAEYDRDRRLYRLVSFGMDMYISPGGKTIISDSPEGEHLIGKLGYFSRLSILHYMVGARPVPLSGKLVNPDNLRGGQLFFRGTHVLPKEKVAEKYGADPEGFIRRGKALGGVKTDHGDASVRLFPLPRVPVTVILWREDEEFPAGADILFDATCESHLPLDMLWSTAMMTLLLL